MKLSELKTDSAFRFPQQTAVWFARGNGWYGWPESGGPYHRYGDPEVIPVDNQGRDLPTTQHELERGIACQVVNY